METGDARFGEMLSDLRYLSETIREMKEINRGTQKCIDEVCKECLVRKIVFWVVALFGTGIVGGIIALLLRSPK